MNADMHPTRRLLDAALEGLSTAVPAGGTKITLHTSPPPAADPGAGDLRQHWLAQTLVDAMRADIDRVRQSLANALGIQAHTADRMWRHLNPGLARFYDVTDPETRD